MTRRGWIFVSVGAALAVAVVAAMAILQVQIQVGPVVAVCRTDDEIDSADRRGADNAALAFLQALLGPSPQAAYAMMSELGKGAVTPAQFEALARQVQSEQATGPRAVKRTYEIEGMTGPTIGAKAPCSEAGGTTFLSMGGAGPKQAHVLVTEPLQNSQRILEVWMSFERGAWRVNGFHSGLSQVAGRDGETLWAQARAQRARGHSFNAMLLYFVAEGTLSRGPFVQPAAWNDFQKDAASFQRPAELTGPLPHHWTLNGQAFSIAQVEYRGVEDGKVVLVLDQAPAPWRGERDADQRNRRLIEAFRTTHPEWTEIFDALVARSPTDTPGQSYGSVYDKTRGYLPQPPLR